MSAESIRWYTDMALIPNQAGMRIRALAKDVNSLTEFVYVVAKDPDGRHFLSTDGTLEGEMPRRQVIAWRFEPDRQHALRFMVWALAQRVLTDTANTRAAMPGLLDEEYAYARTFMLGIAQLTRPGEYREHEEGED